MDSQREKDGRRIVPFVGEVFFLSMFSIIQWLGAHFTCFGQDGGTSLGHLSLKRSTEGPRCSQLPVVALPQCVPCVSEAGQMGCPLSPPDIIVQIHIPMVSPPAVWCLR